MKLVKVGKTGKIWYFHYVFKYLEKGEHHSFQLPLKMSYWGVFCLHMQQIIADAEVFQKVQ